MNLIGKRKLWYSISLLLIVPGVISLLVNGLRLGIDFTGGSLMEVEGPASSQVLSETAGKLEIKDIIVTPSGQNRYLIRYRDKDTTKQEVDHQALKAMYSTIGDQEIQFDSVGPSVSRDITRNALLSILLASLAIMAFIAFAFRNAPPPVSPLSFGVATIVALLHDALFLIGVFSILGKVFGIEVDALFVTAVLTVIGFSVHDTIVVFDRIRENLRRERKGFEEIVNDSILETLARSINTSLTVLMTLLALLLFGGQSTRPFVLALLLGIASGTYSSIFNAAPMLVTINNYRVKRMKSAPSKR